MTDFEHLQTKVLIVEDDPTINQMVVRKLTTSGYDARSTTDGSDAVILTKQFMPDLIILDLMLPGVSGEEILRTLKSTDGLKHIPVIIFTNINSAEDMERILSLGAAKYMVKVNTALNVLIETIQELTTK